MILLVKFLQAQKVGSHPWVSIPINRGRHLLIQRTRKWIRPGDDDDKEGDDDDNDDDKSQ